MKKLYTFVFIVLFLCSCSPTNRDIEYTLSKTQAVVPSFTSIPTETLLPPTFTPSPTLTPTSIPSPTPIPQVIDVDPYNFLISSKDIPSDNYIIPNYDWITQLSNSQIISSWEDKDGAKYIEDTERVDGWEKNFLSIWDSSIISHNAILFKSSLGANEKIIEYGTCEENEFNIVILPMEEIIGDKSKMCIINQIQTDGSMQEFFNIEFIYLNTSHRIYGFTLEGSFDGDILIFIAKNALNNLKSFELSNKVSFQP
jgi:hypothetical protein